RAQAPRVVVLSIPVLPATPPMGAAARAELLAQARDVATTPWVPTKDAAGQTASGDVVWSPSVQRGFMRFVGLAPNDPAKTQYQLWIFDRARDQLYPVDGGVFNVPSTGEIVVPITPRVTVSDPNLFAITVEPPGGVVVSKRERIVVTATPSPRG
ncbi:MAG: anti-sigma factor, partial [Myxococcales bacterium]|nr:anti-sigma factor [Myxococcales bacterium]